MRPAPHAPSAATLGLIALALALPLGLGGCAREGLADYGVAYRTVFPSQVLDPGPPPAAPPAGLNGSLAVRAVEKYAAGEADSKPGRDSVFVIGNVAKTGIIDKRAK